ncbi:Aspartic peptidase domain [Phytophthora cactorum]|nr:Aspartic peptidase domain [Phytophthora cactorum]
MIGFDVIFDTENKRVGFAESDCADTVDVTTSSSTGATSNRASPKFGAFIAEVILISLVGVALAVMVWTKWRTRSWSRIPDATETSRAHMETISLTNISTGKSTIPRSRAARKGPSPKFTIGSPVDEDADEFHEEEEGAGSFPITGWTALLYAVAHSRMGIVQRLLEEETIDLNATTITGSSALTFALSRKNNSLPHAIARLVCGVDSDIASHFPPAEREKCRLVVYANVLALRLLERQASGGVASSSSLSSAVGWKYEAMQQLWWIAAALTGQLTADEHPCGGDI